jgi:deazaflavin-dependent oxidoreductase (nitroreductase family)
MGAMQRRMMRAGSAMSVAIYRASGGRMLGKVGGVQVLLLTVEGRKTKTPHTHPVGYFMNDGRYVVTGSAGGSAVEPQWFRNLRRTDHAAIEVGRQHSDVSVAIAGPAERATLWAELIERAPNFAGYQAKVTREIPMAVLTPRTG